MVKKFDIASGHWPSSRAELKNGEGTHTHLLLLCLLIGTGKALLFTNDSARFCIDLILLPALPPRGRLTL